MLSNVDYKFSYNNVARFILMNRCIEYKSPYQLPLIKAVLLFFSLKDVEDLDRRENLNFFYFFKFFFGLNPQVVGFNRSFILGVNRYDYEVQLWLNRDLVFSLVNLLANDAFRVFEIDEMRNAEKHALLFVIRDVSIFSEMKNNIALFDLKHSLNLNFYFMGLDGHRLDLLNILKIIE